MKNETFSNLSQESMSLVVFEQFFNP